jgi:hypothetical protein
MKAERRYFYQVVCQCEKPEPVRTEWTTITNSTTGELHSVTGFGGLVCRKCGCVVAEPISSKGDNK